MALDSDDIRDIVLGIWHEKYSNGETPAIAQTVAGYPIHTVNGVTLYAAPREVPCESGLYGPENRFLPEQETGIAYFFVDQDWNLVDNFEGDRKHCRCGKSGFDRFTEEFGRHFEGIEPKRLPSHI